MTKTPPGGAAGLDWPLDQELTVSATSAESAIRARRKLTNRIIAAHEAGRLAPFFAPGASLIAGDGELILGRDAILAAFAAQFKDPAFVTYVRTTDTIELDQNEARAAEIGTWQATWNTGGPSGRYLAVWKKITGQWAIESEIYVTLSEGR